MEPKKPSELRQVLQELIEENIDLRRTAKERMQMLEMATKAIESMKLEIAALRGITPQELEAESKEKLLELLRKLIDEPRQGGSDAVH